ncbi:transaldolase [Candidatus Margulisiibacteriota bacterium]
MPTKIQELNEFGQSAWLDNISRDLLDSGRLKKIIDSGIVGVTSNPSIFNKAISKTSDYDKAIVKLAAEGRSTFEIYDELTVKDVRDAADLFKGIYVNTQRKDGYVSLEVSPKLAHSTEATVEEAMRLHEKVNRENLMIKVPATKEGIPAIKQLISDGINVNATLMFSVQQYIDVATAYIEGIKKAASRGRTLGKIASVASVFISRIDSLIDKTLDGSNKDEAKGLKGRAAVANTKLIYQAFQKIFTGADFKQLEEKGARIQRPLWASTSTKDPAYSDIKYVTELIGKNTVNTLPDATYEAFLDHGEVKDVVTLDIVGAEKDISNLKDVGIDINEVCAELLTKGVAAFEKDFDSLISSIEQKKLQLGGK